SSLLRISSLSGFCQQAVLSCQNHAFLFESNPRGEGAQLTPQTDRPIPRLYGQDPFPNADFGGVFRVDE
ncbi:MAG: hypothetical protein WBA18_08210, partial [Terracidiphilus sp.]